MILEVVQHNRSLPRSSCELVLETWVLSHCSFL